MALSQELAAEIVAVVKADPECRRRIDSVLSVLPSQLGISGGTRNIMFMVQNVPRAVDLGFRRGFEPLSRGILNLSPTDAQGELACFGIRDATIQALTAAIQVAQPGSLLKSIAEVDYENRDSGADHTATKITLAPLPDLAIALSETTAGRAPSEARLRVPGRFGPLGKDYVFDWHATLDAGNPLIYPSTEAFQKGEGATPFKDFDGFP